MIDFRRWRGHSIEAVLGWLAPCSLEFVATPEANWPFEVGVHLPHGSVCWTVPSLVACSTKQLPNLGEGGKDQEMTAQSAEQSDPDAISDAASTNLAVCVMKKYGSGQGRTQKTYSRQRSTLGAVEQWTGQGEQMEASGTSTLEQFAQKQ